MIATTVTAVVIILLLTGWVTVRVKGRQVKAAWVAPLWGGGACLVIAAGATIYWVNATRVYDRCITTAERSIGSREQSDQLYDTIDRATGTEHWTHDPILDGRPSLRTAIDLNLPVLDPADCDELKP